MNLIEYILKVFNFKITYTFGKEGYLAGNKFINSEHPPKEKNFLTELEETNIIFDIRLGKLFSDLTKSYSDSNKHQQNCLKILISSKIIINKKEIPLLKVSSALGWYKNEINKRFCIKTDNEYTIFTDPPTIDEFLNEMKEFNIIIDKKIEETFTNVVKSYADDDTNQKSLLKELSSMKVIINNKEILLKNISQALDWYNDNINEHFN